MESVTLPDLAPLDEIPDEEIAAVIARLVDDDTAVPALDVAAFNSAI